MALQTPLVFNVHRHEAELIKPAKPTPNELKLLSDIDDQGGLRQQVNLIYFYKYHPSMEKNDPVQVIKGALSETLAFYYPFAGRMRELPNSNRKLAVECTGEGILFVEASADISLDQFGELKPPFRCLNEFIFDVPGSSGVLHCPLLLVQVTRLKFGEVVVGIRFNHTICDGSGLIQFLISVGEIARGARTPSVPPVWERHLLNARDPPRITCEHHEYDDLVDTDEQIPLTEQDHRSIILGPTEIASLKRFVPPHLHYTTFEIITAAFWKCRTIALQPNPDDEIRLTCIVNARNKFNPPIPKGYYGNCIAYPTAVTKAGDLCQKPLDYALALVRQTKQNVTEEYMQSVADLMVIKGRPLSTRVRTFRVSGMVHAGFDEVHFGWGKPVYSGVAEGNLTCYHQRHKNDKGEDAILVTLCLPKLAMQRFMTELNNLLADPPTSGCN